MLNLLRHSERQDDDGTTIQVRLKHMALSVFEQNTNNHHVYNPATASGSQPQQFHSVVLPPIGMYSNPIYPVPSWSGEKRNANQEWSTPHKKHNKNGSVTVVEANKNLKMVLKKNGVAISVKENLIRQLAGLKMTKILNHQLKRPDKYKNFIAVVELSDDHSRREFEIGLLTNGMSRLKPIWNASEKIDKIIPSNLDKPGDDCVLVFCICTEIVSRKSATIAMYLNPQLDDEDTSNTKHVRLPSYVAKNDAYTRLRVLHPEECKEIKLNDTYEKLRGMKYPLDCYKFINETPDTESAITMVPVSDASTNHVVTESIMHPEISRGQLLASTDENDEVDVETISDTVEESNLLLARNINTENYTGCNYYYSSGVLPHYVSMSQPTPWLPQ